MIIGKIALFFNFNVQYTLGQYIKKHLEHMAHVDVYLPHEADSLRPDSHELYLCIDDGSHYLFPQKLKPSAIWLVDTHTGFLARRIMACRFDFVWTAQKDAAENFRSCGINAQWLPLGCEPSLHGKTSQHKSLDVAFIGGDGWGKRRKLLEKIRSNFPNSHIGRADHRDIGIIYSRAKVVFNRSICNDLNMRVFEALCSGTLLITNEGVSGQSDLFQPDTHLVTYKNDRDAIPLIRYYLSHEAEREKIAYSGMQEVLSRHTYFHKTNEIIRTVGTSPATIRHNALSVLTDQLLLLAVDFMYKIKFNLRKFLK